MGSGFILTCSGIVVLFWFDLVVKKRGDHWFVHLVYCHFDLSNIIMSIEEKGGRGHILRDICPFQSITFYG